MEPAPALSGAPASAPSSAGALARDLPTCSPPEAVVFGWGALRAPLERSDLALLVPRSRARALQPSSPPGHQGDTRTRPSHTPFPSSLSLSLSLSLHPPTGVSEDGQLGLDSGEDVLAPKVVEALLGTRFRGREFGRAPLVAGSRGSLAIDAEGRLLSWGWNARGTLGHGDW